MHHGRSVTTMHCIRKQDNNSSICHCQNYNSSSFISSTRPKEHSPDPSDRDFLAFVRIKLHTPRFQSFRPNLAHRDIVMSKLFFINYTFTVDYYTFPQMFGHFVSCRPSTLLSMFDEFSVCLFACGMLHFLDHCFESKQFPPADGKLNIVTTPHAVSVLYII